MSINNLIGKLNSKVIIKISLIISLLTESSLLYLNTIIEGNIKYFVYLVFLLCILLTLFCDKDLLFVSLKNKRKIVLLKNIYLGMFIFVIFYYPITFYKSYSNLKGSYTLKLFILNVATTIIFHSLLILMLYNFNKSKKNEKNEKEEELIEEEIKKAMINE